ARVLRGRAKDLAARDYCAGLENSAPFVVMFVPSEAALRAALDADADLLQYCQGLSPAIVLASPSTLFAVLALIAQGWRQHRATEKMGDILIEVGEFGKRLQVFLEHFQAVGKGIEAAGAAYNKALASYRSRLSPKAEKIQELQAGWAPEPALKPVEARPLLADAADASDRSA
ncbi:MAG: DNA recombination protein RmuC, partial [Terriglobales bacterium]